MISKKICIRECLLAGLLFLSGVFLFLFLTGTINSGLHLVDDHEFYTTQNLLREKGLWGTLVYTVRGDLRIRLRPLYRLIRGIGVYLFGTNAFAWSICKGLEIAISMLFLYIFARLMNINCFFSAMFSMLILVGGQSAIWWRLGPQESLGIMLFSGAMLATYYLSKKRSLFSILLYIFVLTLLSLQKESFCVSMPGFFILLLALECRWSLKKESWKDVCLGFCKKHMVEIGVLFIIFLIEIYTIVFVVGTDTMSYAGFHANTPVIDYIIGILVNFKHPCLPYLLMAIGTLLLAQIEIRKEDCSKAEICELLFIVFLFGVEQLSYAKSNMWERYLIPWVISILYFIIIIGCRIIARNKRVEIALGGMLAVFMIYFFSQAFPLAVDFAQKGQDLWQCIEYTVTHSDKDDSVIAVTRAEEEDWAFNVIFQSEYHYQNCSTIAEYEDNIVEIGNADILIGRRGQVYHRISEEANLPLENYDFFETENYEVGIKRDDL